MKPLTNRQIERIVKNLLDACADIFFLKAVGYNFIYLCPGFIAHYNIHGFIDYYTHKESLRENILAHQDKNQWRNFCPGQEDYEYYMQKKKCYNLICDELKSIQ